MNRFRVKVKFPFFQSTNFENNGDEDIYFFSVRLSIMYMHNNKYEKTYKIVTIRALLNFRELSLLFFIVQKKEKIRVTHYCTSLFRTT